MQDKFTANMISGDILAYSIIYDATVQNKRYNDPMDAAIAKFESNMAPDNGYCFMLYQIMDGNVKFLEPWLG